MRSLLSLLLVVLITISLCSCQNIVESNIDSSINQMSQTTNTPEQTVMVNGKIFSAEEINAEIKDTFNCEMYYGNGIIGLEDFTNKTIEYDLYADNRPDTMSTMSDYEVWVNSPSIYLVITSMQDISPSSGDMLMLKINITKWGLRSYFIDASYLSEVDMSSYINLGHYTMYIGKPIKPQSETMSDEWIEDVKSEIRLYMDNNNAYGDPSKNLTPGNYHVYLQKFFRSDENSNIIFENENGAVYLGVFQLIHEVTGDMPADLFQVIMDDNPAILQSYIEKVKEDPAVSLEYTVK